MNTKNTSNLTLIMVCLTVLGIIFLLPSKAQKPVVVHENKRENYFVDVDRTLNDSTVYYPKCNNSKIECGRYREISNDSINILHKKEVVKMKSQKDKDTFWIKMKKVLSFIIDIVVLFL